MATMAAPAAGASAKSRRCYVFAVTGIEEDPSFPKSIHRTPPSSIPLLPDSNPAASPPTSSPRRQPLLRQVLPDTNPVASTPTPSPLSSLKRTPPPQHQPLLRQVLPYANAVAPLLPDSNDVTLSTPCRIRPSLPGSRPPHQERHPPAAPSKEDMDVEKKGGRNYLTSMDEMDEAMLNVFVEHYNRGDHS
ncbi:proline-rich receptor-like protein kinase PERK10 [Triticum dicoccoides]|uniref:proline-rich receptor-like protein kinase PERK10 n=1 Tax=Triticum dicoccoides TaxID=85692 RepID=UPI00188F344E|nr:proline-rich receptor-like protein kinase PERK10 [Triticum dicoccoides]